MIFLILAPAYGQANLVSVDTGALTNDEFCDEQLDQAVRDYRRGLKSLVMNDSVDIAAELINLTALKMALKNRKSKNQILSPTLYRSVIERTQDTLREGSEQEVEEFKQNVITLYQKYGRIEDVTAIRESLNYMKQGFDNLEASEIDPKLMITLQHLYDNCDIESDSLCFTEADVATSWLMRKIHANKENFPSLIEQGQSYQQALDNIEEQYELGDDVSIEMLEDKVNQQKGIVRDNLVEFVEAFVDEFEQCEEYINNRMACGENEFFDEYIAGKFLNNFRDITNNREFVLMTEQSILGSGISGSAANTRLVDRNIIEFAGENFVGITDTDDSDNKTCAGEPYEEYGQWSTGNSVSNRRSAQMLRAFENLNNLIEGRDLNTNRARQRFSITLTDKTRDRFLCCSEEIKQVEEREVSFTVNIRRTEFPPIMWGVPSIGEVGIRYGAALNATYARRNSPTCVEEDPVACHQGQVGVSPFAEVYGNLMSGLLEPRLGARINPRVALEVCNMAQENQEAILYIGLDRIVVYGAVTYGWYFDRSVDTSIELGIDLEKKIVF